MEGRHRRTCAVLRAERSTTTTRAGAAARPFWQRGSGRSAETHVRYGYRRVHVMLRREGWEVNAKRVYRIYRELSYGENWVTRPDQAARVSASLEATPSVNLMPSTTRGNWFAPCQPAPFLRGGADQGEDHDLRRLLRQRPLGPDGPVPDRGKDALDRVCRAQVIPVFGGEVEERQQRAPGP